MNDYLRSIQLPDGVTPERVLTMRYSINRSEPAVIMIEVIETIPPAFEGVHRCLWSYEPQPGEQVVRTIGGAAAVFAVPRNVSRWYVREPDGTWINSSALESSAPFLRAPRSGD